MKVCPVCKSNYASTLTFCPRDGERLTDEPGSIIGTTLEGQYYIEEWIGSGGLGDVYRARHVLLGDRVAIKVLSKRLANHPEALRRLLREGQAARRFRHPNMVTIYDLRASNGLAYLVMEYIEGCTMTQLLNHHGPFTPVEAFHLIEPVAQALNAAHQMGVVHRDLKLDNIMVLNSAADAPVVKLLDLSIAKINDQAMTALTHNDQLLGSPAYMSPEQCGRPCNDGGPNVDGRADIYSLAIVYFTLVTGRLPFIANSFHDYIELHVNATPPEIHQVRADVSPHVSRVIARALAKSRADRWDSCEEFINALRSALLADYLPAHNHAPQTEHRDDETRVDEEQA